MEIKYILSLLLVILLLNSCEKDELMQFEESSHAVVFPGLGDAMKYPGYATDSMLYNVTFSFLSVEIGATSAIAKLPVRVVGAAVPYDREVGVKVVEKGTTATPDQYKLVKANIPANEMYGAVEIEVQYAVELLKEERILYVELTASDDLALGPRQYIRGKLIWHCKILPPVGSAYVRTYNHLIAGEPYRTSTTSSTYSAAAHRLILEVTGWETLPHYAVAPYDVYSSYPAYRAKIQKYIDEWNAAHPGDPLVHDGGTLKGKPIQVRVD